MEKDPLGTEILRYLDAETTPEEERALAERIEGDPKARRLLATLMRAQAELGSLLQETGAAAERRRARPVRRWGVALAGGLAVAAAGVALWVTVRRTGDEGRPAVAARTAQTARVPTATSAPFAPPGGLGAPPAVPVPPAAAPGRREVVLRLDFEDGRKPPHWTAGAIVPCPPRPGHRRCVKGEQYAPWAPNVVGVKMEDRAHGLFTCSEGLELSFDYWLGQWTGPRAPTMSVWLYDKTQHKSFVAHIPNVRPVEWVKAAIPFAAFQGERDRSLRIQPGDLIDFLLISTAWNQQDVLFVDDIEIARPVP